MWTMGRSIKPTLHYKTKGGQPCDSIMTLRSAPTIRGAFTKGFGQNLGFKPQNLPWGGFHAQQAPNTNIMTHPRVTLSSTQYLCRVPPIVLELCGG